MNRTCNDCMSFNACKNEPGVKLEPCERFNHKYNLTANEYQALAARTINKALTRSQMEDHALKGMTSELGELHGVYQKEYQGHPVSIEHLKKETGDILWCIAEYCTSMGWTLEEIMLLNIEKLRARYPEGFDAEHSLNRAEGDI